MRLALLLLPLGLTVAGCAFPTQKFTRTANQIIETSPINSISLKTFNGAIEIEPHAFETVEMTVKYTAYGKTEEEAMALAEEMDCSYTIEGDGVLTIEATKPPNVWNGSASFVMKVPANCPLNLNTSNGRIKVSRVQGSVDAKTSNGSITLSDLAERIVAKTSNGRIEVENCSGSINLHTSNGSVQFSGWVFGRENEIQTSNGSIEVLLAPEHLVEVEAKTSNSSITCDLPLQEVLVQEKKNLHAFVGQGEPQSAAYLKLKTSNGKVRLIPMGMQQLETGSDAEVIILGNASQTGTGTGNSESETGVSSASAVK